MKTLILIAAILSIGCNIHQQKFEIEDVREPEQFHVINEHSSTGFAFLLTVTATGWIDGNAELCLLKDDYPFRSRNMSGDVDFTWSENFTAMEAEITYDPVEVNSGSLTLVCEFKKQ